MMQLRWNMNACLLVIFLDILYEFKRKSTCHFFFKSHFIRAASSYFWRAENLSLLPFSKHINLQSNFTLNHLNRHIYLNNKEHPFGAIWTAGCLYLRYCTSEIISIIPLTFCFLQLLQEQFNWLNKRNWECMDSYSSGDHQ